jgi:hypothetical protein
VAKQSKKAIADERAVAFRWLAAVQREAEDGLEGLGLRRDSWRAVSMNLDALETQSRRDISIVQLRSDIDGDTRRDTGWPGEDLAVLSKSNAPADKARIRLALTLATRAWSAHTALLLCERFPSLVGVLRSEASSNAGSHQRRKVGKGGVAYIVQEGRKLIRTVNSVKQVAHLLAARPDIQRAGERAKGSPYTANGIRELLREHGVRSRRKYAT